MADEKTFSISGLNRAIGNLFARETPAEGFWVRGDIQRLSVSRNGHCYFELVERDAHRREPKAVAAAMIWSKRRTQIEQSLGLFGLAMADDLSVRVRVRVTFYEASGKVTLDVVDIDPTFTAGDLAVAREQVRRKLRQAGLFEANQRLRLAAVPLRVALVTSGGSAAFHDFTHELEASGYAFAVELFDTRVSGPGAAGELAAALRRAAAGAAARESADGWTEAAGVVGPDVIVLIRGGGARSELTAFDSEVVARALATAPVPVWVGVGHEIDRSICDEIAQRAFKTPTATAQALVAAVTDFVRSLELSQARIGQVTRHRLAAADAALERSHQRLRRGTESALDRLSAGLERAEANLRLAPGRRLRMEEATLDGFAAQVRALDPVRVLARGYSITRAPDGTVVREAAAVAPGNTVTTQLAEGRFTSVVETTSQDGA